MIPVTLELRQKNHKFGFNLGCIYSKYKAIVGDLVKPFLKKKWVGRAVVGFSESGFAQQA